MRYIVLAVILAFIPSTALAQAVGNGPTVQITTLYASTNTGSNTSGVSGTFGNYACQTGSTNCSSGTLSFTTGTSQGVNNKWLVFLYMIGSTAELTAESVSFCINSASTFTVLAASWNQAGTICAGSPSGQLAGSASFGNNALTQPGLQGIATAYITVANSTSFSMTCGSTVTAASPAATLFGFCSAYAVPF